MEEQRGTSRLKDQSVRRALVWVGVLPGLRFDWREEDLSTNTSSVDFFFSLFVLQETDAIVSAFFVLWVLQEAFSLASQGRRRRRHAGKASHQSSMWTPHFSPKRCKGKGGWNCKEGLPYIFWVSIAQNDAEGEHRLVCPALDSETISSSHDPSSSKKNFISVSFY